jgi:predicted MFS family arabinose efflux permease
VSAVSYVPFIGVALLILPKWTPAAPSAAAVPRKHLLDGVGEILREPQLRAVLLTFLASGVLCAPLITFTPVLVKEAFHGSAARFSEALVSFGAGGLVGAAMLLAIPASVDRRRLSFSFALVLGAGLVLIALNPWFWALPPLLVIAGASMTISNTAANTFLQGTASPHLLGRTVSVYMLSMRGGISIGALVTGATVGFFGVRHALLANGALAVVVQAMLIVRYRTSKPANASPPMR